MRARARECVNARELENENKCREDSIAAKRDREREDEGRGEGRGKRDDGLHGVAVTSFR